MSSTPSYSAPRQLRTDIFLACMLLLSFAARAFVQITPDSATIGTQSLERSFEIGGGTVRTVRFTNALSKDVLEVDSDEFLLRLPEATSLTTHDFELVGQPVHMRKTTTEELVFRLRSRTLTPPLSVTMVVSAGQGAQVLRKQLILEGTGGSNTLVEDVEVERFRTDRGTDLGGFGQPIFIPGDHFFGLEHPAGYALWENGTVVLRHHPGFTLTEKAQRTKQAVWGVAESGGVEQGFAAYLGTIRRPARSFVVYNTWYDVRRGDITPALLMPKLKLFADHGVKLDSFVLDDGWQEPKSIWAPEAGQYPDGFTGFSRQLRQADTNLGLWLPLTPVKTNLDLEWGAAQGFEVAPGEAFYCVSGERYQSALCGALEQYIVRDRVNYFKHDFNVFACSNPEHRHLPTRRHAVEANVDAEIEVFGAMRRWREDVYINPSGGMWLSPWWLMHVDTVWMRYCHDFGYAKSVPAFERRDWAMTYRDGMLWRNLRKDRCQFPVSGIMTIGIIYGKRNMLGGKDEPLDRWADNVVLNMGRGTMLKELYITPELLSADQWRILRRALAWADANKDILAEGGMILGSPTEGQVYGYEHVLGPRAIVCLRNPALPPQQVRLPLVQLPTDAGPYLAEVTYPYRQVLSSSLTAADALEVEIGSHELLVIEICPAKALTAPVVDGVRYSVLSNDAEGVRLALWPQSNDAVDIRLLPGVPSTGVEPGRALSETGPGAWRIPAGERVATSEVAPGEGMTATRGGVVMDVQPGSASQFVVLCEDTDLPAPATSVSIDGEACGLAETTGEGWSLRRCDLPVGRHAVEWRVEADKQMEAPFRGGRCTVSTWLMDTQTLSSEGMTLAVAGGRPDHCLPTPCAGVQRRTRLLAGPTRREIGSACRDRVLTEADLRSVTAAKLHLAVFGAQGGKYADKTMVLNGRELGRLPTNGSPPDVWEECVIDVPRKLFSVLKLRNEFVVRDRSGDSFKVTDVALAVQLPDGRWAESGHDPGIYTSTAGWLHAEGTVFRAGCSPVLSLEFRHTSEEE